MTSETISETIPTSPSILLLEPPLKSLVAGFQSGSVDGQSSSACEDTWGDSDATSYDSDSSPRQVNRSASTKWQLDNMLPEHRVS